jgi:hypothetical protein
MIYSCARHPITTFRLHFVVNSSLNLENLSCYLYPVHTPAATISSQMPLDQTCYAPEQGRIVLQGRCTQGAAIFPTCGLYLILTLIEDVSCLRM